MVGVVVMIPVIPHMVRFLERWVSGAKEAERSQPAYLNEAALQLPDTAMEVLIKETGHLFDNAFEIIAHGINVHRRDILSQRPLDVVMHKSRKAFDLDVMKDYQDGIKLLYNEIVEFATNAGAMGSMTTEQSRELDSIRIVCRHIAQVVKNISDMRENLVEYLNSNNEHIAREYDVLRLRIATVLREIYRLRELADEVEVFMSLTRLRDDVASADVLANGTLDRLVRDGLISNQMATSLMNDSEYTHDISTRLLEIAERMFIAEGADLKEIGEELLGIEQQVA
jgi:phosphate:Na+ symporter